VYLDRDAGLKSGALEPAAPQEQLGSAHRASVRSLDVAQNTVASSRCRDSATRGCPLPGHLDEISPPVPGHVVRGRNHVIDLVPP
jgi:hypothetical protein